jgi:hypothetical protein
VRNALKKLRSHRLLFPLLMPVGITVLYLPHGRGQELDLDNLARRVVPFFHDALRPPSDLVHSLEIDDMPDGKAKTYFMAKRADLSGLPKVHVASYQVLRLPRTTSDPVKGNVRLLIHVAEPFGGVWNHVARTLSDWSHELGYC